MQHLIKFAVAILAVAAAATVFAPRGSASQQPHVTIPQAGPWYTPAELKALIRYSKASFAEKQRILAGETKESTPSGGFHWGDAGVGAGAAVGVLLGAGLSTRVLLQPRRMQKGNHA